MHRSECRCATRLAQPEHPASFPQNPSNAAGDGWAGASKASNTRPRWRPSMVVVGSSGMSVRMRSWWRGQPSSPRRRPGTGRNNRHPPQPAPVEGEGQPGRAPRRSRWADFRASTTVVRSCMDAAPGLRKSTVRCFGVRVSPEVISGGIPSGVMSSRLPWPGSRPPPGPSAPEATLHVGDHPAARLDAGGGPGRHLAADLFFDGAHVLFRHTERFHGVTCSAL